MRKSKVPSTLEKGDRWAQRTALLLDKCPTHMFAHNLLSPHLHHDLVYPASEHGDGAESAMA